jgi:hypothetical protein
VVDENSAVIFTDTAPKDESRIGEVFPSSE